MAVGQGEVLADKCVTGVADEQELAARLEEIKTGEKVGQLAKPP
jgi:hypothetical protein